ncbi:MAG TPA: protein kinase [Pyrinomonadaceae bacterium]|nr:protein kinase [Pyrinomonadaceae bacterium]
MTISPGTQFGRYEIRSKLGAGGMGEVYLAQDTKLRREVAIKVLPETVARDPDRLTRFEREARLLAALNHPNIASIYGLEEHEQKQLLVMELVKGKTLAETLAVDGPLSVNEALKTASQIAEAVETAHERGIIHRDLKPANVMITEDENVKVLDFGLAKALAEQAVPDNISESPTVLYAGTQTGIILGTATYMSPEQAKGKKLDKRTDIWSFGCILFEMLTGKPPFAGETTTDTLASIVRAEPDWTLLPPTTPPRVVELLKRCLEKDPRMRLRDMGDARIEITNALTRPAEEAKIVPSVTTLAAQPSRGRSILFGLAGLVIGALVAALLLWRFAGGLSPAQPAGQPARRFTITPAEAEPLALTKFVPLAVGRVALAISPDGSNVVYVANRGGHAQLVLRPFDQFEGKPISGTEGAYNPFFSPDGKWVGFFADNKLKKVSLSGGEPVTLCEARNPICASWRKDDEIFFGDQEGGTLTRVSVSGGTPKAVSTGGAQVNDVEVLPGNKWLLFSTLQGSNPDNAEIRALSLETGKVTTIMQGGSGPHYLASGHLLFTRSGALLAAPFDLKTNQLTGPAVAVLEGVRSETYGNAQFSVSNNGTIVYMAGAPGWMGKPVWVDRQGKTTPIDLPAQCYGSFKLSPDGKRLAISVAAAKDDIWIYELERGTFLRLTNEGNNINPVWSPDGRQLAFSSIRDGHYGIFVKAADGSGNEEQLASAPAGTGQIPESWSPDGKALAIGQWNATDQGDIWILPLDGKRELQQFLRTQFSEFFSSFSPNGRWLAYTSDESGRYEVYVRPYPGPGGKWQISTEGGEEAVWSANGQELFYRNGEKWMVAVVRTNNDFRAETPALMFENYFINVLGLSHWPQPDGQRQVMIQPLGAESNLRQINVVLNWFEDLKRQVPPGK